MGGPKLGCIKSTGTDPKGALLPPSKTPLSPSLLPHPPGGPARAVAHWAGSGNDEWESGGGKSVAAIFWPKLGFAYLRLVALPPHAGFKTHPPPFKSFRVETASSTPCNQARDAPRYGGFGPRTCDSLTRLVRLAVAIPMGKASASNMVRTAGRRDLFLRLSVARRAQSLGSLTCRGPR